MTFLEGALYGIFGGMLPEILAVYNLRHAKKTDHPSWLRSPFYWSATTIMILLGGATVLLYQKMGVNINELIAVQLGCSTPLLISAATKEKPKIN